MTAIRKDFGSFEIMKEKLSTLAIAVQGSGWGWLGYDRAMKRLQLACCANQDLLEPTTGKHCGLPELFDNLFMQKITLYGHFLSSPKPLRTVWSPQCNWCDYMPRSLFWVLPTWATHLTYQHTGVGHIVVFFHHATCDIHRLLGNRTACPVRQISLPLGHINVIVHLVIPEKLF